MVNYTHVSPSKTALLVIDVQRALFTQHNPVYEESRLIQTINNLVEQAHLYGVQVIYIQHANSSILLKGTEGWQFHPKLKPNPTNVTIQKVQGNAFLGTELQSTFEAWGIQNILITGLVSHQCIKATSLGGIELGYKVFLIKGGHSNYRKDAADVIDQVQNELEAAGVMPVFPEVLNFG